MFSMDCPLIPRSKAKEAIKRTADTGREHGFVMCPGGDDGEIVSGEKDRLQIAGECDERMGIFHTHPNGALKLSDQDREVLAMDDVEMVCVGVEGGEIYCERTKPSCKIEL